MLNMIRQAQRPDFAAICDLLEDYFKEGTYGQHIDYGFDRARAAKILYNVTHMGYIWLYEADNRIVGALAAVREPNIWFPQKISMSEMFSYVKPEYRHRVGAAKLFVAYERQAQELLNNNSIDGYFMTEMSTTSNLNLESRGFRLAERLYIKD
jgi:N-acetylglutamate synthase-like GNAT family acetyltransferase